MTEVSTNIGPYRSTTCERVLCGEVNGMQRVFCLPLEYD